MKISIGRYDLAVMNVGSPLIFKVLPKFRFGDSVFAGVEILGVVFSLRRKLGNR